MRVDLSNFDGITLAQTHPFQVGNWVKIQEIPSPYSFDEAMLLCQISNHEWITWIPDYGEAILYVWQMQEIVNE
ncbi:hypothetical protein NIES4101_45390 [Calothrix sp. NIES-4101]|nr:hypothetical protein NIES4101_45390 [Calothrix sp. NIES-4101]